MAKVTSGALKGQKIVPKVSTHGYLVQEKWGEPSYYKSFAVAKAEVNKRLRKIKSTWDDLMIADAIEATSDLLVQLDKLTAPGVIAGVVDPYSGLKIHIEIVRRSG